MTRVDLDLQGRESRELLIEIRRLIEEARRQTTVVVNIGLTGLYWRVGKRIQQEILGNERATYGEQIVVTVSRQLMADYGRGYSEKNLRRMVQFAEAFPEEEIVVTLSRQLSWSHFSALLPLSQPSQRDFYAEMARIEGWSVRTLRARIDSMLYGVPLCRNNQKRSSGKNSPCCAAKVISPRPYCSKILTSWISWS
jgi:DUF1016 N-terminal domain